MVPKLLVVDDNTTFRTQLQTYLEHQHFQVVTAADGDEALRRFEAVDPDVVILDVAMPVRDGMETCRLLRRMPTFGRKRRGIILISGERKEALDKIVGLELGADKYLTKPIEPGLLVAEVRALYRMVAGSPTAEWIEIHERLRLHPERRVVELDGAPLYLTKLEFDLLAFLVQPPNKARSRYELAEEVWGEAVEDGAINRVISQLRKKIEPDPDAPTILLTVYGLGYKVVARATYG